MPNAPPPLVSAHRTAALTSYVHDAILCGVVEENQEIRLPLVAWQRFPRLLIKVNEKRLRRIEYTLETRKLPPNGCTPPDPENRSTQNVPPYASFWKH